jgi:hypothetical protein
MSVTSYLPCFYTIEHYNPHNVRLVFNSNVTDKSIKTHTPFLVCAYLHHCTFEMRKGVNVHQCNLSKGKLNINFLL